MGWWWFLGEVYRSFIVRGNFFNMLVARSTWTPTNGNGNNRLRGAVQNRQNTACCLTKEKSYKLSLLWFRSSCSSFFLPLPPLAAGFFSFSSFLSSVPYGHESMGEEARLPIRFSAASAALTRRWASWRALVSRIWELQDSESSLQDAWLYVGRLPLVIYIEKVMKRNDAHSSSWNWSTSWNFNRDKKASSLWAVCHDLEGLMQSWTVPSWCSSTIRRVSYKFEEDKRDVRSFRHTLSIQKIIEWTTIGFVGIHFETKERMFVTCAQLNNPRSLSCDTSDS